MTAPEKPAAVEPAGDSEGGGNADRGSFIHRFRAGVAAFFFPESIRLTGQPLVVVVAISGLFVLACYPLLLGWRSFPAPQRLIWAEDGSIFLHDAATMPWWSAVHTPYAGYMHLVPRTIAAIIVELPVERWALAIALISITIRAIVAVVVWHATSGHVPSKLARAAISTVIVTIPLGGAEVLNNLANLHWFLLFASVPALLWRPSTWFGIVVQSVVVGTSMLSDPLTLLWVPFVVLRLVSLRTLRDQIVSVTFAVSAVVQLAVTFGTTRQRGSGMSLGELVEAYLVRTVEPAFAGITYADWAWQSARLTGLILSGAVVILVVVGGLLRPGPHRGLILSCMGASVVLYAFMSSYSLSAQMLLPEPAISVAAYGRYGFVAGLLLLTAIIGACWAMLHFTHRSRPAFIVAAVLLSGVYVNGVLDDYGYRSEPGALLGWRDAVVAAQEECSQSAANEVAVPVDPSTWKMYLPCEVFTR